MATDQRFVDYIVDQLSGTEGIGTRKMFGEYALYCGGKVVALICDNQVFVKKTAEGEAFIGSENCVDGFAYPGAKPSFLITEELDDQTWLSTLIQLTAEALPEPKPKKKK